MFPMDNNAKRDMHSRISLFIVITSKRWYCGTIFFYQIYIVKENISLKEACVALGFLTAEKFDEVFHPEEMV